MPLPIFPLVLSLIGAYLIYRGWAVRGSRMDTLSGTISSQMLLKSTISKTPCVLCLLKLEYMDPKSEDWKKLAIRTDAVSFSIGSRVIDPSKADIYIGNPRTWVGHIKREKGTVEEFADSARKSQPGQILTNLAAATPFGSILAPSVAENQFIPDDVADSLKARPEFKKYLDQYKKYAFRVSEDVVPVGSKVDVLGDPTQAASTGPLKALVVSTQGPDITRSAVMEKANVSILVGAGLIVIAVLLFVFLI